MSESAPASNEPFRKTDEARLEIVRLVPSPERPLQDVFRRVCELAADTLRVERVGIWLFVDERQALRCANLFELSRREHSEGTTLRVADFPVYFQALETRKAVPAETALTDPRTRELGEAYLLPLGITSMLDAPIFFAGTVLGVVCHEHTGAPREWSTEERDFAGSVADQLANKIKSAELSEVRTALRLLDGQLTDARRLETIGRFAAGVAHDLRNVLTVIIGMADTLAARTDLPTGGREQLRHLVAAAERGTVLSRELADCARNQPRAPKVVSPGDRLRGLRPILDAAVRPDHRLDLVTGPPHGKVFIDPSDLDRMVLNLVLNARDAMPPGGTVVVAANGGQPGGGDLCSRYICLSVTDTGTGIDPADRDRLFEPYFTTKGRGTGLGLTIVKQIVDRSGGQIDVQSEPGRGTTFRVYLPRVAG